jgi:malate synthase
MNNYISASGLQIAMPLYQLVTDIAPGVGIDADHFWFRLADIFKQLAPENKALLKKRDQLQQQIDDWHCSHSSFDLATYKAFLMDIGYYQKEGENFQINTENVDDEIALIAGPQLVVPLSNARFALNAANARWGSLYDALYGSDVIPENPEEQTSGFSTQRAQRVIDYSSAFLDQAIPLANAASHKNARQYHLLKKGQCFQLEVKLSDGQSTTLADNKQFCGFKENSNKLDILLNNNNLHIIIQLDTNHPIGKLHAAGIKDIVLESAITTIQDCEDSVAAVNADDKVGIYRNWLGLMQGDLKARFEKNGKTQTRQLNPDRVYTNPHGQTLSLPGRSLLLIRHVGHLMTSDAVLDESGEEIPEGILDAMVTTLIALYDVNGSGQYQNSKKGSIYVVKPKMHGAEEVAFCVKLFSHVETALGLPANTLKIGIMDEERRTTVNLKECIRAAKERLIFINTGFLDRTGDEIHTSMQAGAFLPKAQIKKQPWIEAYEDWNVDIGLACGLKGKAQIGKGMWAMPDEMAQMMQQKIAHPKAGANCAWVPSPTAATLHAMHYHQVLVSDVQDKLASRKTASLDTILSVPLLGDKKLSDKEIQRELDENTQSILGYVVRWIDQGIGCSKVPDIHNIGLMEDRATLRISSQLLANWLMHGICNQQQLTESFERMAIIVDKQNANDPFYSNMAPDYSSIAYRAALDLVFKGHQQPNGYTEPILHAYRKQKMQ